MPGLSKTRSSLSVITEMSSHTSNMKPLDGPELGWRAVSQSGHSTGNHAVCIIIITMVYLNQSFAALQLHYS